MVASPMQEKGSEWKLSLAQYALGALIVVAATVLAALGALTVEWAGVVGLVFGGGSYAVGQYARARGEVKAAAWQAEGDAVVAAHSAPPRGASAQ